jgi:hypothetical protein
MITKKIFLASSSELIEDRKEFEIFINRKNKDWVDQGIFLELVVWEDFLDAVSKTRLQDEYNKAIRECDIFVMLFFTKVGQYTEEEFETAFGQFKATNKPFIYTYFKDTETNIASANEKDRMRLLAFQNRLHSVGHFPTKYQNIAELKLHFTRQLDKLTKNKLTWDKLRDICKDITKRQMETVTGPYLQREHVRQQFKTFLANSAQRGFVLLGKSGVGKSSFLLKFIEEVREPACVLMYDANYICLSSNSGITDIVSEDFTKRLGQEVKGVWSEIHKIQEKQVIFCVDAINSNQLLTQLNGLVLDPWGWLKIVFICRFETWRSIKSGVTLPERFYAEVEMQPFSRQELPQVHAEYQREYHLETPYGSLSNELRETLRDPFNLWLLAKTFGSQAMPETVQAMPEIVKASELITLYVDTLLQREDLWFLEHELVPLMVGIGHYSDIIRGSGLYRTDKAVFNKVFSGQLLSDGRLTNESFLRLADAEILVRRDLGVEATIQFKHHRFYEHFAGEEIASLSETQAARYAFFLELIEEIAGKKAATDGTRTTSKPFLWGAVRNALVKEARESNSEIILKLCRTTEGRVKEMMVDVLVTLGRDLREKVEGILKRLLPEEKEASELQKPRRVMSKGPKESEIVFRNTGTIAIEVASTLGIARVLQQAALREDPSLRTEAVRYSYYLWQRDRAAGFDVLEYVAEKATAGLIPDLRAFEFVFGLSVIIFFEHHEDEAALDSLQRIWRRMIATLFRVHEGSSPGKARVRDFIRERIIGFIISLVFGLFEALPSYTMVSYKALKAFFKLGTTEKALYRRLVYYFDVEGDYTRSQMEYDYLEAIQIDNVLIMLTTLIGLVAQACAAPLAILPFLKELFDAAKREVTTYPYLTIISNVAMEVLYRDPMNGEMFDFFVETAEVCQEYYAKYPKAARNRHLAEAPLTAAMAPYIIFEYRRRGTVKTAWLEERIQRALEENNLPFFEHLLKMELPQVGIEHGKSRAALETIELFFQQSFNGSLEENNRKLLQEYSIAFLSRLRIHEPDEVDAFLDKQQALLVEQKASPDEQQALKDLRLQLSTNQPVESIGDLLGKRGWYFLRDRILLGSSTGLRSQLMGLFEKAADSRNTKAWMDYNIRLLINLIYGGQVLRQPR